MDFSESSDLNDEHNGQVTLQRVLIDRLENKETCKIDWNKPISAIYNHIRGLSPYPTSWTTLKNGDNNIFVKIYHVKKEIEEHDYKNGKVIFNKKEMKVAVSEGYINLIEIQLPGKRKMKTCDILNGIKLDENSTMM